MEKMKLLGKIAPFIHISCIVSITVCIGFLVSSVKTLQDDINNIYLIQVIQARQIETLFNIELRRTSPEIQERLDAMGLEYEDPKEIFFKKE